MNAPQSYRVFVLFRKSDSHTSEAQRKGRSGNGVGSLPPRGLQLMSLLLRQSSPHRNMCTPRPSRPLSSRPPYPIDTPQILLRFGWSYWSSSGALRAACVLRRYECRSECSEFLPFACRRGFGVGPRGRQLGNWECAERAMTSHSRSRVTGYRQEKPKDSHRASARQLRGPSVQKWEFAGQ
ncbi:hypothetical protein THAOC_21630 [Thalassiosira oceanica]|uniref:Uncharacterized protein n=1 Tax=Thalassiosira oceanica TaxID=159749 RepID=K0S0Q7_THAOC|nr:hypothetical protein THAOC_21630 [Thalassiosira oceanica]|eukprot:EJK58264.1 hypothetical protein THAOC_21630 [Thalassiosira oceanica]